MSKATVAMPVQPRAHRLDLSWVAFGLVLAASFPASPAAAEEFPRLGTVTGDRVNVRAGPSTNHHAFTTFERGTQLVVSSLVGEWYRVHLPSNVSCWINIEYVSEIDDKTARVEGNRVNIRITPGTQQAPVGQVTHGERLHMTGRRAGEGQWLEFYAPLAATACIHKDYVELGRALDPKDLPATVAALKVRLPNPPPSAGSAGLDEERSGAAPKKKIYASKRLLQLQEEYRKIRSTQEILAWDFSAILAELEAIRASSEDVEEAKLAEQWIDVIRTDLELKQDLEQSREKQQAGREQLAEGEKKESDISKAVHRYPPQAPGEEFLATGWVVTLGRHSQIDGTHKLMKGNKLLFYLKSDADGLSLDHYANKCVGIRGTVKELDPVLGGNLVVVTDIHLLSN